MLPLPLPQVSRTDELFLKTRVKRGSCHLTGELKQIEPCCARTGTGSGFNPCIFIDLPWRQREKNLSASVTSANRAKPSQAEVDVSNQPRPARPGSLPSLGMLLTDRRSRSITGWFAPARVDLPRVSRCSSWPGTTSRSICDQLIDPLKHAHRHSSYCCARRHWRHVSDNTAWHSFRWELQSKSPERVFLE